MHSSMPTTTTKTLVTETNLLDELIEATDFSKTQKPKRPSDAQRNRISELRAYAAKAGGEAAEYAKKLCQPTFDDAQTYIVELDALVSQPAVEVPRITPKQFGYIKHLRGQLRKLGEGWARELASKRIADDRRVASRYIDEMILSLRARAQQRGETRGTVCSVCWSAGCSIGPMVTR